VSGTESDRFSRHAKHHASGNGPIDSPAIPPDTDPSGTVRGS
jgi:hypothetical protein